MPIQTVQSDTTVLELVGSQNIPASSTVLSSQPQKTIQSITTIALKIKDLFSTLLLNKSSVSDKNNTVQVTQTVPTAPVLLTAIDLLIGDSVRLVWSGTGPRYNVYYKPTAGGPFTLANATPLPGSQTQYDVGGLVVNVNYTFMVRGVNGAGVESPNSNTLTATPTVDVAASRFKKPTWEIKVNGVTNPDAKLISVELGFGSDLSNGVFVIHKDPDLGGFPNYNDSIDIIINSRLVLKGKVKGISSHISESGLTKTFTVISNITKFQETVVPIDKAAWNVDVRKAADKVKADTILTAILGFAPPGTPSEVPGEVFLTDQTLLDATDTVLHKLGNFKIYFNLTTEQLEAYKFGEGGTSTRMFMRGVNILDFSITENRQAVVDKLTLIGPPRAIRSQSLIPFDNTTLVPDETGLLRRQFSLGGSNIRDVQVDGFQRDRPTIIEEPALQVLPEDLGFSPPLGKTFAEWPTSIFTSEELGNARNPTGFRNALKSLTSPAGFFSGVGANLTYINANTVNVIISDIPKVYYHRTASGLVEKKKLGIAETPFDSSTIHISVLRSIFWLPGSLRASFTRDGNRPTVVVGGGTVERSITDSQYQILINNVSGEAFNNETAILAEMQKRADAEFERLNRPKISGTITVLGDETVDLRTTVDVNGQKLDVVKVIHNFTNGFTTQVALTNEPFIQIVTSVLPRQLQRREQERIAGTDFRLTFLDDVKVDKNIATQRQSEFQKRLEEAGQAFAAYQD